MASLLEKASHIQILISVVIRKDGAHKRYQKNVSKDRATPKLGDAARLTKSSYPVCSGLSVQRGMGSTVPDNLSARLPKA